MEKRKVSEFGFMAGSWPLDPVKYTLVFIHGASFSNVFWKNQVEALEEQVNTVALDLPGHGESSGGGRETIEEYSRVVLDFIDSIKAPRPVLCGHSMGGAITQQLLIDHRDRFGAGILISTGSRLKVMPGIFEMIKNDSGAYTEMLGSFAISEKTDPELIRPQINVSAKCRPEVTLADFRACNDFDVMEQLGSIEVPVLIVAGNDDNITPLKYGIYLHEHIKNSRLVQIKEAGHLVPLEKPDEVNKAINEFLENIG